MAHRITNPLKPPGFWRPPPGYRATDIADVFFRFDFVVEADVAAAVAEYVDAVGASREAARAALTRRGDMLFPPIFQRVWLDAGLQPILEEETLRLLEVPDTRKSAGGAFDANLNPHWWQLVRRLRLPLLEHWAKLVHRAGGEAEAELRRSAELNTRSAAAVAVARGLDATRFAQLRARARSDDRAQAAAEERLLSLEQATAETPYAGIRAPAIVGRPAAGAPKSFIRKGTPANGAAVSSRASATRAPISSM